MSKSVTGPEADAAPVFVYMRRYPPPGTGFSGIVPRVGRGKVGPPLSTPCAWPKGLKRPPSLSRQSPHKRSSRFPSRGVDGGIVCGVEGAGISVNFRSLRKDLQPDTAE